MLDLPSDCENDSTYDYGTGSDSETENHVAKRQKGNQLTTKERHFAIFRLALMSDANFKVAHGGYSKVAQEFNVDRTVMTRLWENYTSQVTRGNIPPNLDTRISDRGRKCLLNGEIEEALKTVVSSDRELTVRGIAYKLAVEHGHLHGSSTIHRWLGLLGVRVPKSHVKPTLTTAQKIKRLEFVLGKLNPAPRRARLKEFNDELKTIHVNEKWFYVTKIKSKIRFFPVEELPTAKTVHHESHIAKIMFLAAVGVPHSMPNGEWFDGKIGMWAFAEETEAQRSSVKRPKETLELKEFNVGSEEYLDMCIKPGGLLTAVRQKMTGYRDTTITIQYDGAKPHTVEGNPESLRQAGLEDGWKIEFVEQPPQSPDLNKVAHSLFAALQARAFRLKTESQNLMDLKDVVMKVFNEYPEANLTRAEALRLVVYREILKQGGGNQYAMPHAGISKRQNSGVEEVDRKVEAELVESAREALKQLREV